MIAVRLSEYESRSVPLSAESASCLHQRFGHALDVRPTAQPNHFELTASSFVGTIRGPDIEIRIDPKISTGGLFHLIGYAHRLLTLHPERVDHDRSAELYDILLLVLAGKLEALVLRGLRRGYVEREEDLPVLRGRLMLRKALHRHAGAALRIPCRHEEFTADLPFNQIIRDALERLPLPRHTVLARRLRRLRSAFRVFTRVRFAPADVDTFQYDRLTAHYEPIHRLCRLLLESAGVDQTEGGQPFQSFLVDMNVLFERFVTEWLRAHAPPGITVANQHRAHLDHARRIPIRPDILLQRDGKPVLVADTKYKIRRMGAPASDDAYQALAYCKALGVATAVLIYPAGAGGERYAVRDGETTLLAEAVELASDPAVIERGMGALMQRLVQELRTG